MFYQLLDRIKEKPAFFLNQQSVTSLHSFLIGWTTAKNAYQLSQDEDEREFAGFQKWVAERYNIGSSQSWPRIIAFYSKDDKESLALFFDLLDEYRLHSSSEKKQILTQEERRPEPVSQRAMRT